MRISISNIAWAPEDDQRVAALLRERGIDAVDVAPGKYFEDVTTVSDSEVASVRSAWDARGLEIVGMQSLLFGTAGLNLFGPPSVRARMIDYLDAVCRVGGGLGARHLVFGSPRNRDRSGLADDATDAIAVEFFRQLGDRAQRHRVRITLEPNPEAYGANFMTTSSETARIVRLVAHEAIRMQLDLGACAMNEEDVPLVVDEVADLVGHVHLSEPGLAPLGDGASDHRRAPAALRAALADRVACIEMVMTTDEPATASVERAADFAVSTYGGAA
ncbi:sugar phosphate isomerase/epimerase family protein [Nocardioides xinjiangensis]|uniref:sugar phosphate isomerase/epimerase family protein n=1 Tax=Nocardioides xinjiangensis TaxID=2817376 RepID=UPI001B30BB5D|nr:MULTISPECIES: TIM barrel protein [unclassified Nocardioides]